MIKLNVSGQISALANSFNSAKGVEITIPAWDYSIPRVILHEILGYCGDAVVNYNDRNGHTDPHKYSGYRFFFDKSKLEEAEENGYYFDIRDNGKTIITDLGDIISFSHHKKEIYSVIKVIPNKYGNSKFLGYCIDLSTLAFRALGHGAIEVKVIK